MVGGPRSNGCLRCVKRRVKCDRRVPGCARCETYGQPCPGYDKGFKFITGKPYRDKRRPAEDKKDETPKSGTSSPEIELDPTCQALIPREEPASLTSPDGNVIQHLCVLIDDFSQPVTPSPIHAVTRWFGFLPSIYGQNRVLDATIRSFTAHHFGRLAENPQMVSYARSAYGEALRGLRRSLGSPAESLSTHIFCAVVLLCMYELFTDTDDPESWMRHAKGLSQLVKIRGPDRYSNALEISLLKASRGLIVMHSMFSGEECFLASDVWHEKMRQQFTTDLPSDLHYSIELFFAYFTHAPSLVHKLYSLRHMDVASAAALQTITEVLSKALEMQAKLATWYEKFSQIAPLPVEIDSLAGDELYPVILTYTDVNQATIYCGYYSYMVIIHEILRTCCQPGEHAAMVVFYRDQICKSVEYTSVGIMGPYRMGFPLRVAVEIVDPVTRSWILSRLGQFSKTYAAAQPENYKPIL